MTALDRDWNRVILKGWTGNPARVSDADSKTPASRRATFSLATHRRVPKELPVNAHTQWEDHTEWHHVVCWGSMAERAKHAVQKGARIWVEGSLRQRQYVAKDGTTRQSTEIHADQLVVISPGAGEEPPSRREEVRFQEVASVPSAAVELAVAPAGVSAMERVVETLPLEPRSEAAPSEPVPLQEAVLVD